MVEEIRGVTWDLWGEQLKPWIAAQRLYKAGFKDLDTLAVMWATIEAESGGYLQAWHHNVKRNPDGSIFRSEDGLFEVLSTDLGFIQKNMVHNPHAILSDEESPAMVRDLFDAFPDLARADKSAEIAHGMFLQRGFDPWYAYKNGSYKKSMGRACAAVGNFVALKHGLRPIPYVQRVNP